MAVTRPEIFVSAVTKDLGTCRGVVKEALLTMGCTPVKPANFPPHAEKGTEDAVGHDRRVPGGRSHVCKVYGSETVERGEGEPSGGGDSFSWSYRQISHINK